MTQNSHGRHRAAPKSATLFASATRSAGKRACAVGRGSALLVASSGLVVGAVIAPTGAVAEDGQAPQNATTTDLDSANVVVSPVFVSESVIWSDEATTLKVKRAPEPEKEPEVAAAAEVTTPEPVTRETRPSRSAERTTISSDEDEGTSSKAKKSKATGADADAEDDETPKKSKRDSKSDEDADDQLAADGAEVLEIAKRYLGVPYVYGGATPKGFDCSGFTSYVFNKVGISLPRTSSAQRHVGTVVSAKDAVPGDLVWTPGHIAIYVGNGKIIHSPRPGKKVEIVKIYRSNSIFIRVL